MICLKVSCNLDGLSLLIIICFKVYQFRWNLSLSFSSSSFNPPPLPHYTKGNTMEDQYSPIYLTIKLKPYLAIDMIAKLIFNTPIILKLRTLPNIRRLLNVVIISLIFCRRKRNVCQKAGFGHIGPPNIILFLFHFCVTAFLKKVLHKNFQFVLFSK